MAFINSNALRALSNPASASATFGNSMYARPTYWIFPEYEKQGKKPRSSSVLTADPLRPAAIAAGVKLKKAVWLLGLFRRRVQDLPNYIAVCRTRFSIGVSPYLKVVETSADA